MLKLCNHQSLTKTSNEREEREYINMHIWKALHYFFYFGSEFFCHLVKHYFASLAFDFFFYFFFVKINLPSWLLIVTYFRISLPKILFSILFQSGSFFQSGFQLFSWILILYIFSRSLHLYH